MRSSLAMPSTTVSLLFRRSCHATLAMLTLALACNEPPAETKPTEPSEPALAAEVLDQYQEAKRQTTCTEAQQIASAVEMYLLMNPGTCPTDVAALVEAKLIPRVPDGAPSWTIACTDNEVTVSAPGLDERMGTSDDIVHGPQLSCARK